MNVLQGAGLGYKRSMAEDFRHRLPDIDGINFIEAAPENWLRMGGAARRDFDSVAERFPLACHGLSLSLGGRDPLRMDFLKRIKDFIRRYRIGFFSEHLSYCGHNGFVYDLLPLPFTWETVRHTAARIRTVQDVLEMRIAIENTSYYAHSPLAEMSEVEFLNAVAREAADLLIDTHGQPVCDDVWELFADVCRRLPRSVPTLLERDNNLPPFAELEAEVARIAAIQQQTERERREHQAA